MIAGYLRGNGVIVGEERIRRRISPHYVAARQIYTYRQLNPHPYYAEYFGHKIHLDQNEKLKMYGVVHVAASDGFSGMILGVISIPKKKIYLYMNYCIGKPYCMYM